MPIAQLVNQRHEVPYQSAKPIQLPDEQDIPVTKLSEARVESGALVPCARGLVGKDQFLGDAVPWKCFVRLTVLTHTAARVSATAVRERTMRPRSAHLSVVFWHYRKTIEIMEQLAQREAVEKVKWL